MDKLDSPSAGARWGHAAEDRISFFDEQKRRRRAAWLWSGVCLLIASGIGVVMSCVITPMLLLAGGGLLHLLARLGIFPDMMRTQAHAIGAWVAGHSVHFQAFLDSLDHVGGVRDLGVTVPPLLRLAPVTVPALIAACFVWIVLHRIALRAGSGDLIMRLRARPPNPADREEHQLANIVAELAIAADVPTPSVLLIDSELVNAAAVDGPDGGVTILVTRSLLDQLDRNETSGIVAHLIASIGAGDMRLTHGILAVFQTFGFFVTFLDLPFRWSAWRALGGLLLVILGLRRSPDKVTRTLDLVESSLEAEAMPDAEQVWAFLPYPWMRKVLLVPLLPLLLVSLILRAVLFLWTALFLGPPLSAIWRMRRYAADSGAVRLTRDPDGLARALSRIGGSGIPEGGEGRAYCFVQGPNSSGGGAFAGRRNLPGALHPPLGRRLHRLHAQGAVVAGAGRNGAAWLTTVKERPWMALVVIGLLLLLLVPLGLALIAMVFYLTAIVMTMGLALGLAIAAALLG